MSERGLLIVLSAPSGCGKTTIVNELLKKHEKMKFSVSATTRPPREGEVEGESYFFVSHEKFAEMIEKGEFLEHAQYAENRYGTPRGPVERELEAGYDVLLDIETQGAFQVRKQSPDAILVFLFPPSFEELERRLVLRGKDSAEAIKRRLEIAKRECLEADKYDYRIVNDVVGRAVEEFNSIIEAEHRKINKQ